MSGEESDGRQKWIVRAVCYALARLASHLVVQLPRGTLKPVPVLLTSAVLFGVTMASLMPYVDRYEQGRRLRKAARSGSGRDAGT